jgi:hypothetical protein
LSRLTEIRQALRSALPEDLDVQVLTGPQDRSARTFQGGSRSHAVQMIVRVLVGPPTEEAQERLDRLLDEGDEESIVGALIAAEPVPLKVLGSSGWRTVQTSKDSPPQLGAEWTVEVEL